MTHVPQQFELDFGNMTIGSPLTYNTNGLPVSSNHIYTTNNTNPFTIQQSANKHINITADDIIFTKDGQTKSLFEMISKIEERLSILVPDPKKLEQFEALKHAYENYKILEAICFTNNE